MQVQAEGPVVEAGAGGFAAQEGASGHPDGARRSKYNVPFILKLRGFISELILQAQEASRRQ